MLQTAFHTGAPIKLWLKINTSEHQIEYLLLGDVTTKYWYIFQTSQPGSRPGREILVINSHAVVKAHAGSMHTHHFKQNLLKMA